MPARYVMRIEVSPLSEIEEIRDIGFEKRYKSASPDKLRPPLSKTMLKSRETYAVSLEKRMDFEGYHIPTGCVHYSPPID